MEQQESNTAPNPAAFPVAASFWTVGSTLENGPQEGMTLRDYFAGQALVSMRAHPANERPDNVAQWAYWVADAMLARRTKGGSR